MQCTLQLKVEGVSSHFILNARVVGIAELSEARTIDSEEDFSRFRY
jgi:hypothetical protein